MKFNTIIIGGGLSGLTAGLALQKAGQRVAIVSKGQSTLHFSPASFDLLGYDATGAAVEHPLQAIAALPATHPYSKCANVEALAQEAQALLEESGISLIGTAAANHYRITPMGVLKPAWLTLADYATTERATALPWKKVALINAIGCLDFPTKFIAAGLRKAGAEVDVKAFTLPELEKQRQSPSEMRATNIAKVLSTANVVARMAQAINAQIAGTTYDAVLLPGVLQNPDLVAQLKSQVSAPVHFIATLPPSAAGVHVQTLLRQRFIAAGGVHLTGDKVVGGTIESGILKSVTTENLIDTRLEANHFILATGSFMSGGMDSNYESVFETVFGLDVDALQVPSERVKFNVFEAQPYMEFGVSTNEKLQVKKDGQEISNCYAVGSVLSGANRVKQSCGTGISMLTALQVVKHILNK